MKPNTVIANIITKLEAQGLYAQKMIGNPDMSIIAKKARPIVCVMPGTLSHAGGQSGRIQKYLITLRVYIDDKYDETGSQAISRLHEEIFEKILDALTAQVMPDFQMPMIFEKASQVQNAWFSEDLQFWYCDYDFSTGLAF